MSASIAIKKAIEEQLPVLFVLIGWTERYDGSELVYGAHKWLQSHPKDNWELEAFRKEPKSGQHTCGIGHGPTPPRLHVVFVARDPSDHLRKAVGVYAAARVEEPAGYKRASTKTAVLFPPENRPVIPNHWWGGDTGVRRWASRGGAAGKEHVALYEKVFLKIVESPKVSWVNDGTQDDDQTYIGIKCLDGVAKKRLVTHRSREVKLRRLKIRAALKERGADGLTCEVPGCGFNFAKQYGALGNGYVHVHHRTPLSKAPKTGQKTSLSDLAILCANCHAMVHKGGMSRPLAALRPKTRIRFK